MDYPKELKYSKDHEWVLLDGNVATIGVTKFALDQLGDIVHIEMPEVGEEFAAGAAFGTIESTKTVSDLCSPISGKIMEINEEVLDNLEGLAEDPYDEGWLIKVEATDGDDVEELMDAAEYEDYLAEQE